MTTDQKLKAVEMRLNGATLREIANEFGCSKQNIQKEFQKIYDSMTANRYQKISRVIYKGVANWLLYNGKSVSSLAAMVYDNYSPRKGTNFFEKMRGERVLTIQEVKKILEVTGMTFEECFEEREVENEI